MCISNDKTDFINEIKPISDATVDGITSHLKLEGVGNVRWSMFDTAGNVRHLILPAFYAPKARQRLLSTSVFCKTYPNNAISLTPTSWTIKPDPNKPEEHAIDILINPINNLPMTVCHNPQSLNQLAINFSENITSTHASNFNLSEPHKELLRWHY